jgi:hypothetical protein
MCGIRATNSTQNTYTLSMSPYFKFQPLFRWGRPYLANTARTFAYADLKICIIRYIYESRVSYLHASKFFTEYQDEI